MLAHLLSSDKALDPSGWTMWDARERSHRWPSVLLLLRTTAITLRMLEWNASVRDLFIHVTLATELYTNLHSYKSAQLQHADNSPCNLAVIFRLLAMYVHRHNSYSEW